MKSSLEHFEYLVEENIYWKHRDTPSVTVK